MYIVLLGPPGSGKGTQAGLLSKEFKTGHMSTGDILRDILKDKTHPLYEDVKVINQGMLISDELVTKVVRDSLSNPKFKQGVIFDGYPRTSAQAKALDKILSEEGKKLDFVLDLNVTEEVLLYRLLGRRVCPSCKKVFHVRQGITTCPDCGLELVQRADDNKETINKRFTEYKNKSLSLKEYYKNTTPYIELKIDQKDISAEEVERLIHIRLGEMQKDKAEG